MKQSIRGRLAGLASALLLVASLGPTPVQAAAPPAMPSRNGVAIQSPYTRVGTPAGQLYASGTIKATHAIQARTAALGSSGRLTSAAQGLAGPAAGGIRPHVAPNPVQATQTTAPDNHVPGFAGLNVSNEATPTTEPADSTVAVGPDHVVQIANLAMRITDRTGTQVGSDISIPEFFGVVAGYFDRNPRVIFDSLHGRFVATETSWDCTPDLNPDPRFRALFGHGYIDLAVSRTTDPNGIWDLYFWSYLDQVPDDASIGTSTDKLGISNNLTDMTQGDGGGPGACADPASLSAVGGDVLIANWADAIANKSSEPLATEYLGNKGAGPTTFGGRTALQAPATSATLYLVTRSVATDPVNGVLPDDVEVTAFTGTTTKSAIVAIAGSWDLTRDGVVAPFADPVAPHQPGLPATIVNALDGYAQDALWQAGKLTWGTTYPCTPSGDTTARDCVRVSQVATTTASAEPTTGQDFLIARNGYDTYMPGIGLAGDGTLDVVYNQSNTTGTNYPALWQQYQRSSDGANHVSPPVTLHAGSGTYPGSKWGTYVGLGQDPQVAAAVWQAGAYSAGAGYWSTFVDPLGTTTGTTYVPIMPTRIVDSRDGTKGESGLGGKFVSSLARTFPVANLPGIPAQAVAVTGNVTVTRQNAAGFVAVTPTAQNNPTSSTLNFPLGDTRANNVTVPLSSTGSLSMTYKAGAGKTTDLLFDVTGYFLPDDSSATYHPVGSFRLLNSVSGIGQPGGTPARFVAGTPQTFLVGDGVTIPVSATAITGNLTVTNQKKAGFLAITPDPTSAPPASNLNFPLGENRANGFTAPLNGAKQLSIVYMAAVGATTDVIVDVTGYYAPGLTGLHFYPLNPGRVLDSRAGAADSGLAGVFTSSSPRTLPTTDHWGIPVGALALTGNLTVVNQSTRGYAAITLAPNPSPATSTLNFPLGDIRANGVTVPLSVSGTMALVFKGTIGAAHTNLILDVSGYFQ